MSHIRKHGLGYQVVVEGRRGPGGKRRQLRRTVRGTKREALKLAAELEAQVSRGAVSSAHKESVSSFMERWLTDHVVYSARPTTVRWYRDMASRFVWPHIGDLRLDRVGPADVQRVLTEARNRGLKPSSVRRVYSTMSAAFNVAVKWNVLTHSPCGPVSPPRETDLPNRSWDSELVRSLLDDALKGSYGVATWTLAFTGMRRAESCALTREAFEPARGTLTVLGSVSRGVDGKLAVTPPKTKHGLRTIALDPATVTYIRRHLSEQAEERLRLGNLYQDAGTVFQKPGGGLLDPDSLTKNWQELCRAHGIRMRLHDLRHHHGSILAANGVSAKAIQARLGHASPAFTLARYIHHTPAMDEHASAVFGEAMNN